jgi:DNA-directed RNA polymerase specialized sigma24 family protein
MPDQPYQLDRDEADLLADRADWLANPERAIARMIWQEGITAAELAPLLGKTPRAVQRIVADLRNHLTHPHTAATARMLDDLNPDDAAIARMAIIQRRQLRHIADELGLTLWTVRQAVTRINAAAQALAERLTHPPGRH